MEHVEVRRRFDAPPQAVWAKYSDHAGWSEWSGFGTSYLEKEGTPDRNGVGCVRVFGTFGFNAYEEVVEWEPPHRFAYRIVRGPMPIRNHYGEAIFTADGDGTLVTWRCRFESSVPGLGPLLRWIVTRVFRTALHGLARKHFPDRTR